MDRITGLLVLHWPVSAPVSVRQPPLLYSTLLSKVVATGWSIEDSSEVPQVWAAPFRGFLDVA